jgi:microcystin-dependent protein
MAYPTNPTSGDTYTLGSKTWTYNGTNWVNQATFATFGGAVPSGTVIYYAANAAPANFIKANGAAVSRTTYAALFTAIGTTFGVGDGSTTFNVPDLRGEFPRGWDDSRGIDTSRSFGSAQADEFKLHGHPSRRVTEFNVTNDTGGGGIMMDSNGGQANKAAFTGTPSNTDGQHIGGSGGSETRPRNIALLACIKY